MEVKEQEEDRISLLPDCLIIDEILSRLDETKYAIRTCTLSKRWQYLWPSVRNLIFYLPSSSSLFRNDYKKLTDFYVSVDETLTQCRHRHLKNLYKFSADVTYNVRCKSHVENWIHFAIDSNVEQLDLILGDPGDEPEFVLEDDSFFVNSHFTHLHLGYCILNPSEPISWKNLTRLTISRVELYQDLISIILSGSPLLDTLTLESCYGFSCLDITSKSVKKLVFDGYAPQEDQMNLDDIIEINAPYISSLTIRGGLLLWKLLLVDVSSLVRAELDYSHMGHCEMRIKEEKEELLKRFILRLTHVKELQIGISCFRVFSRLKAKGFSFPSNLKAVEVTYPLYDSDADFEISDFSDNESSDGHAPPHDEDEHV